MRGRVDQPLALCLFFSSYSHLFDFYRNVVNMENIFHGYYYYWNRLVLCHVGVWPEQKLITRILVPSIINIFLLIAIISGLLRMIDVWGDFDQVMETLPNVLLVSGSMFILMNTAIKTKSTVKLMGHIQDSWKAVSKNPPLIAILERYALAGRKFTIFHAVLIWSGTAAYSGLPVLPVLFDIVAPLNASRPKKFLFRLDYGVDEEKHYYWLLLYTYLVTYVSIATFVIIDTTYSTWVQHCCALFEMTGYCLKNAVKIFDAKNSGGESSTEYRKRSHYANLSSCIGQHNNAIEFANTLETAYSLVNGYVVGGTMFMMSMSGVILVMKMNNIDEAIRYVVMIFGLTYHLFHTTFFGQRLINHSIAIGEYTYDCDWTEFSPEAQKLLILIIKQAQRPCFLTAAKVYVINMENFSAVVKTSISYFTVLSSLQ